ncbi:hypothetical protein M422DRAFT_37918 [Sphaerobolus stellatus SS14]|uniref:Uncharacterized protein n=1 Tax=Sphaerobolus stellatus (strain SS14) TaxID=990650 RepID=A0A0C9TCQ0_SPHS4|nr:hypothetical protein M422DRAFT_38059 [Sphaerobolus stellatus SS14]KIJ27187.1 hypothetical protein M422DRAFT_37918 [Sphaerobolus stellatus SS14]
MSSPRICSKRESSHRRPESQMGSTIKGTSNIMAQWHGAGPFDINRIKGRKERTQDAPVAYLLQVYRKDRRRPYWQEVRLQRVYE